MKITCEHCRGAIDIEHDKKCPTCGASYGNNQEFKKIKDIQDKRTEYEFRQKEAEIQGREISNELLRNSANIGKKALIAPFIGILIFFVFVAIIIFMNVRRGNLLNEGLSGKVEVNFNETAETNKYDIKVDEVVTVTEDKITTFFNQKDENSTYYGFHILFKNKTDSWNNLSEINCTYTDDDIKLKRLFIMGTDNMSGFAKEQLTYEGYIYCEVPNNVNDVNIKFENTKVIIKDFRELIK
jgi:hypothetical protein